MSYYGQRKIIVGIIGGKLKPMEYKPIFDFCFERLKEKELDIIFKAFGFEGIKYSETEIKKIYPGNNYVVLDALYKFIYHFRIQLSLIYNDDDYMMELSLPHEIYSKLKAAGLNHIDSVRNLSLYDFYTMDLCDADMLQVANVLHCIDNRSESSIKPLMTTADVSLHEILPHKYTWMLSNTCDSLDALLNMSQRELLKCHGIGTKALQEIIDALKEDIYFREEIKMSRLLNSRP